MHSYCSQRTQQLLQVLPQFLSYCCCLLLFAVVQLLSHVQLFATPWTAAGQATLSSTISWSLLKFMFIESSNHLILCPLLLLPSFVPSIRVFSSESALHLIHSLEHRVSDSSLAEAFRKLLSAEKTITSGSLGCKNGMMSPSSVTKEAGSGDLVRTELKAGKAVLTKKMC